MTARSARAFHRRVREQGGFEVRTRLTKEAHDTLTGLADYHRLDKREVVERLILGLPLSERTTGMGLCPAEVAAYEAMGGTL